MNIYQMLKSPLMERGLRPEPYLRLVLAEAAQYGMPPQIIATLDDVAAMLGFYEPLPANAASHMAGPMASWRTDRHQPTMERASTIENLALKQRCLIAFGAAAPGHLVGTAEIIIALGNTHKEFTPEPYQEIFEWASIDVHHLLTARSKETVAKAGEWKLIADDEVLQPTGRLNKTYQEIATSIRRSVIAALQNDPDDDPRKNLIPFARSLLNANVTLLEEAKLEGITAVADNAQKSNERLTRMFPVLAEPPPEIADKEEGA